MKLTTTKRPERTKINGNRSILNLTGADPDFKQRIVNDVGDRVAVMKERGYEVVTDSNVRIGERRVANPTQEGSVVSASVGGGVRGVVMQIPNAWYEEDQADKLARINETESAMSSQASQGMYGKLEIK